MIDCGHAKIIYNKLKNQIFFINLTFHYILI